MKQRWKKWYKARILLLKLISKRFQTSSGCLLLAFPMQKFNMRSNIRNMLFLEPVGLRWRKYCNSEFSSWMSPLSALRTGCPRPPWQREEITWSENITEQFVLGKGGSSCCAPAVKGCMLGFLSCRLQIDLFCHPAVPTNCWVKGCSGQEHLRSPSIPNRKVLFPTSKKHLIMY